jgi:hypothetical protein
MALVALEQLPIHIIHIHKMCEPFLRGWQNNKLAEVAFSLLPAAYCKPYQG